MYTVAQLVEMLNLQTENQVRNRLDALREQLFGHLRRGPNNQLLVTEAGLDLLRSLQALCETGHTLREAASLLRYNEEVKDTNLHPCVHTTGPNSTEPHAAQLDADGWRALVEHLAEQVGALEARVVALEAKLQSSAGHTAWWERWR